MKYENLGISGNDKLALISNFATMLAAGIPILETIESLLDDAKGNTKKILEHMQEDLIQGKRLNVTLSQFPRVFDRVTVNIIKASEEAGTLEVTLRDIKENIKKEMEFSDKVKTALFYPMVISVVFLGVLLVILTFVIPRIADVFSKMKIDLPLPTRILIIMSDVILKYTIPFLIIIAAIIGLLMFLYLRKRKFLIGVLISLPLISELARKIDLTRLTRSLHLLLGSGIPITTSLDLASEVVMKTEIALAIKASKEMVLAGKKLSEGFKGARKIFPGILIKITEAGERTGSLEKSMQEISEYMDYQVSGTLRTLVGLLEPVMLVFVGLMVGAMMLAIIAPIYGMIGKIK